MKQLSHLHLQVYYHPGKNNKNNFIVHKSNNAKRDITFNVMLPGYDVTTK